MKLLLFSDIHLDASYTWLPPKAARKRRQNLRATLRNIAHLAQEEEPDAINGAGDVSVQCDAARTTRLMAILHDSSADRQVVFFTQDEDAIA